MKDQIIPPRILVVDDDALSREVLALLLDHSGYAVEAVESGDAAVRQLESTQTQPPNVILADMRMPGTTGKALASQLRDLCGTSTKLLAMSGSMPDQETIQQFDGLLLKPFTIDQLNAAIAGNGHTPGQSNCHNQVSLDETIYRKLASSMRPERLEKLYSLSLSDLQNRVARMRQAASYKDDVSFRKEAHAIRGSCGMVGAVELSTLAASMEENGIGANHVASLDELIIASERLGRILMARRGNVSHTHTEENGRNEHREN